MLIGNTKYILTDDDRPQEINILANYNEGMPYAAKICNSIKFTMLILQKTSGCKCTSLTAVDEASCFFLTFACKRQIPR